MNMGVLLSCLLRTSISRERCPDVCYASMPRRSRAKSRDAAAHQSRQNWERSVREDHLLVNTVGRLHRKEEKHLTLLAVLCDGRGFAEAARTRPKRQAR